MEECMVGRSSSAKAMNSPSGDQVGFTNPVGFGFCGSKCEVSCVLWLPSGRITQISGKWGNPGGRTVSEGAEKAISVPSGDHDGTAPLSAMRVMSLPFHFIT